MPRSRAICACDLLLDRTSWTASCLNSRVKVRCSFCMILSLSVGSPLFQVYILHFSGSRPNLFEPEAQELAQEAEHTPSPEAVSRQPGEEETRAPVPLPA